MSQNQSSIIILDAERKSSERRVTARLPRRAHGTVHSAASRSLIRHRSVLEQMNGFGPDFHVLRVTEEPCARDSRCAEIDARFPSKPALGVFERLARIPGLDPRTGVTERRSHVAAEPTRPRPLQRSGEIRRTGDSRVSASWIHVYRVFKREFELN